ncbi:MAG: hypothetical protein ACOC7R_03115 [Planctomycetota bacterium]
MTLLTRLLTVTCIVVAPAARGPATALAGDILIDPCSYDRPDQARAVWKAVDGTPPVSVVEVDRRRMVALGCDFVDRPALEVARWRRSLKIDLTGHLGVRLDVYCDEPARLKRINLALLDEQGLTVARGSVAPLPGWNTLAATTLSTMDPPTAERWAAIEAVELTVHPARRVNVRPAIADLRVIGPDPLISLLRLPDRDCLTPRRGEMLTGAIRNETFRVNTLFGPVALPAEQVVGLETTDAGRSSVRVLLTDGQVVSGTLMDPTVRFELTPGELVGLPIGRVRQCAFRLSPRRPAYPAPQAPVARVGEGRIALRFAEAFRFVLDTPHGPVALAPELLARLEATGDGSRRWKATLRSGSALIGTPAEPAVTATWRVGPGTERPVTLTAGHVRQFRWPVAIEPPAAAAEARLADDQVLYGQIAQPALTLKGGFGAEAVDVDDVVTLALSSIDRGMATLTLHGGQTKRAPLLDKTVAFRLLPDGPTVPLRVDRLLSIDTAGAQSAGAFEARIDRLVRDLDAPGETDRRDARRELIRIGPSAAPLLRQRLGTPNPIIRRALLEILAEIG